MEYLNFHTWSQFSLEIIIKIKRYLKINFEKRYYKTILEMWMQCALFWYLQLCGVKRCLQAIKTIHLTLTRPTERGSGIFHTKSTYIGYIINLWSIILIGKSYNVQLLIIPQFWYPFRYKAIWWPYKSLNRYFANLKSRDGCDL